MTDVYETELKTGIRPSPEFVKKRLADYAVNIGVKCGHGCLYCSTPATPIRCHHSFKEVGRKASEQGFAVVDPSLPERVAKDAARTPLGKRGIVQVCTTVDAWAPEAMKDNLGRRCLEAILAQPGWTVRVLTKNAVVVQDFDLIAQHRDRVLVSLSVTATPDKSDIIKVIEPNASTIVERMDALRAAHSMGLRTYGMLCPLLPGISDDPGQIEELVRFATDCGAAEIFVEPVNPRGSGLKLTQEALTAESFQTEAAAVDEIRKVTAWSAYVAGLVRNVQRVVRDQYDIEQLRILLYPSRLTDGGRKVIERDDAGVVWLEDDYHEAGEQVAQPPALKVVEIGSPNRQGPAGLPLADLDFAA
jgi:DNA repair photolyase